MNGIVQINYISLESDERKRKLLESSLERFKGNKNWIRGVIFDNENTEHKKFYNNGVLDYVRDMGQARVTGVLGCWMAHTKAIDSIRSREGYSLVLEDDFVFKDGFFESLNELISKIDFDFDLMLIDPKGKGPYEKHRFKHEFYDTNYSTHPHYHGTHCVLVNNSSIPKISNVLHNAVVCDIDGFYLCEDKLKTYAGYTYMATTVYFNSNVRGIKSNLLLYMIGYIRWCWFKYL